MKNRLSGIRRGLAMLLGLLLAATAIPMVDDLPVYAVSAGEASFALSAANDVTANNITLEYTFYDTNSQAINDGHGLVMIQPDNGTYNNSSTVNIPVGAASVSVSVTLAGKAFDAENSFIKVNGTSKNLAAAQGDNFTQSVAVTDSDSLEVSIAVKNPSGGGGGGTPTGDYKISFSVTDAGSYLEEIMIDGERADANNNWTVTVNEADTYEITLRAYYPKKILAATVDGSACTQSGNNMTITVNKANSYTVVVSSGEVLEDEVNILWTYDPDEQYTAWSDAYIDRSTGTVELIRISRGQGLNTVWPSGNNDNYDGLGHQVSINSNGGYVQCLKDDVITLLFTPAAGYQLSTAELNGQTLVPTSTTSTFKVTMSGLFHLSGAFTKTAPQTSNSSSVISSLSIAGQASEASVGTGNVAVIAADAVNPSENDVKAAMTDSADYVATVGTVDIDMMNIISKGGSASYASDASNYWATPLTDLSRTETVKLGVANNLSAGETYGVVRYHNGVREEIASSYNTSTGLLTFGTRGFSDYTIIKKKGTPVTNPEEPAAEDNNDYSYYEGDSSGEGNSDDDDTPPSSGDNGGFLGVVNGTNTISSWNELDSFLKSGGDISALGDASGNTGNSGSSGKKSTGKIVDLSLSGNNMTIPASIFASLSKSSVSGMHILTNNGIALTFGKSKNMTLQGSLDIYAKVTRTANSVKIAFNKPQTLFVPTALHTTVPKGTKTVKLFFVGPDGRKYFLGNLKPNADGQVMFLIGLLGTYELVY